MTDTQSSLIFNNAAQDFATHAKANKFTADEVLEGYGLYKQAIAGDIPNEKNNSDAVQDMAWSMKKGIARDEAASQYIAFVDKLKSKYSL
ncbi:acyl-CoA-binding protein [Rhizophagus diaphanus]|nr:acyl-CoA-binding protein [Rhizophagus diaphanus] [Rhizophagus sp. MUCL 43196]